MNPDRAAVDTIKANLADPLAFLDAIGLDAKREGHRARLHECPWCGSSRGCYADTRQGVILARCHTCGEGGDIFALFAAVRGLDARRDFTAIKNELADLAHVNTDRPRPPKPPPMPPRDLPLPPRGAAGRLWNACRPCADDPEVAAWLVSRGLDPAACDRYGLCAALPIGVEIPRWAWFKGDAAEAQPWNAIGCRAIFRLFDAAGELQSVRARQVRGDVGPKSCAPRGFTHKGLLLADPCARVMLSVGQWTHLDRGLVVVAEGEPDFLTWASKGEGARDIAAIGIAGAGAWTQALADRIPDGSTIAIWTDDDRAGDAYATAITASIRGRCNVLESFPEARAERRRALGPIGRVAA